MANLEYTAAALDDLDTVWAYTLKTWCAEQAERYIEALESTCISLASGTMSFRPFPALGSVTGYRRCKHHYIFFMSEDDRTVILAVLHERMDLIARLKDRL